MDMTIKDEIEQLILRCIASDGLKACPKDLAFLEKYGLKNLFFFSVEYGMEGADTQSLDGRAKSQIRWNLYVTDFPLLRRMYERERSIDGVPLFGGKIFQEVPKHNRTGG